MIENTDVFFEINGTVLKKYLGKNQKTVVIPEGITEISRNAFYGSDIVSVQLPSTLKWIGVGAFRFCLFLDSVEIPDSVNVIDDWAFFHCVQLKEVKMGKGVRSLGAGSFCDCDEITDIVIPQGVKKIAQAAFSRCKKLKRVELPDSVEKIDKRAFEYCESLQNVTLPSNLQQIDDLAFSDCGVANLTIPASVTQIGMGAFAACNISTFKVEQGSPFHMDGGCIIDTAQKRLVAGCPSSKIPEDGSVTNIAIFAFNGYDCNNATITVPLTIETIENNAFCNCKNLQINCKAEEKPDAWPNQWYEHYEWWDKIDEDEYEKEDDIKVKWGCMNAVERVAYEREKQRRIALENAKTEQLRQQRLQRINELKNDGFIVALKKTERGERIIPLEGDFTVEGYVGTAKDVIIPADVEKIEKDAFKNNETVTSVNLGGVNEVCDYAFTKCESLQRVTFSDKMQTLRAYVFADCVKLNFDSLPENITIIEQYALSNTAVKSVKLSSVIFIGNGAFYECQNLTDVVICGDSCIVRWCAFKDCKNLQTVEFNFEQTRIEWDTFSGCYSLTSVKLPQNLKEIGDSAFADCVSLQKIDLPETLQKIKPCAFNNCKSLTELIIPKSVTEIGDDAFLGCKGLKKVVLSKMLATHVKRIFGSINKTVFQFV